MAARLLLALSSISTVLANAKLRRTAAFPRDALSKVASPDLP